MNKEKGYGYSQGEKGKSSGENSNSEKKNVIHYLKVMEKQEEKGMTIIKIQMKRCMIKLELNITIVINFIIILRNVIVFLVTLKKRLILLIINKKLKS